MLKLTSPFFARPQWVIDAGVWPQLTPSAKDLYVALLHQSQRCSSLSVRLTDKKIRERVGASSRALRNARTKLFETGMVSFTRAEGAKYVYTIHDPIGTMRSACQPNRPTGGPKMAGSMRAYGLPLPEWTGKE